MEAILLILLIGFCVCFFVRHPLKSIKYILCTLTFLVVGYIVIAILFFYLLGANI